jgi:hypothetical protein
VELEIQRPRGYFDYIFESEQVFEDAYEDSMQHFDRLGYPAAGQTAAAHETSRK